ncbi:MAG: hypothetical protein JNJ60_09780 [Rhodocyclaceae bacterium]|nr:hypothetical protein [Rhodocyclaceae bacterium]
MAKSLPLIAPLLAAAAIGTATANWLRSPQAPNIGQAQGIPPAAHLVHAGTNSAGRCVTARSELAQVKTASDAGAAQAAESRVRQFCG